MISNSTILHPAVYYEQENFQSVHFLENFAYPYFDRREVLTPDQAIVAENDTKKWVSVHQLYIQNSVVCLEEPWSKFFGFVKESREELANKLNNEKDLYECDEPILKLNLEKTVTKYSEMSLKKFDYEQE